MFALRLTGLLVPIVASPTFAQISVSQLLARTAEEAEVFQQNMPKALTREVLVQRTLMPPGRFHPRIGSAAFTPPHQRIQTREIVSEYTVGPLTRNEDANLVEWRQIVAVDGRNIQSADAARQALNLNLKSPDERLRKRLLEDLVRYGLVDVATDYGLILLAFTKRAQARMSFDLSGECWIGTDHAAAIHWRQTSAESGELAFRGRQTERTPLEGVLWVRKSDGLPLRVHVWAEYGAPKQIVRDEASVDYAVSPHGFLTPASVWHRHLADGRLITENYYIYEPFRLFHAESELKFTGLPPAPSPPK